MKKQARLFKFSGPTSNALENLENGQIFCQHYAAYNDPFEFWTTIVAGIPDPDCEPKRYLAALRTWGFGCDSIEEARDDEIIQGSVESYFEECNDYVPPFEEMRREVRISCFSSEANNLLMWSHYGDGLRGFCIAFDEQAITRGVENAYVLDVAYRKAPPQVDSFIYAIAKDQDWYCQTAIEETKRVMKYNGKAGGKREIAMYEGAGKEALTTMRAIWQLIFATKPAAWKYERERRLLVQTDREDVAPVLRRYDNDAIRQIILGERMPEEYKAQVLAVMHGRYPNVPITTARRSIGDYVITVEE